MIPICGSFKTNMCKLLNISIVAILMFLIQKIKILKNILDKNTFITGIIGTSTSNLIL